MTLFDLILIAISLSMDAFAVSVCKGLSVGRVRPAHALTCGAWFGGFQALMPTLGYFLGTLFAAAIEAVDHWIAFGLLAVIGVNMLKEAASGDTEGETADLSVKTMFILAVATSIDALAVGISLAMVGQVNIFFAAPLIGLCTCLLSAIGVKVGNVFGSRFEKKAQIAGGVILICMG